VTRARRVRLLLAAALGLAAGGAVAGGFAGCVEGGTTIEGKCPPIEDFRAVSAVLEQRCGTLDCHGDDARPLKIYGRIGLRAKLPAEAAVDVDQYYSGGSEQTTDFELELNYRSLCGLEPEVMNQMLAGDLAPSDLTLVRKPRLQERHKGGKVWDEGKPGDRCLVKWLLADYEPGSFDPVDCNTELGL
jgi:hypothetical protein